MPRPDRADRLFYGDNLDVMRRHLKDESIDLIYLDPPFNSERNYDILFQESDGTRAAAQVKAFEDTWRWDAAAEAAFHDLLSTGGATANAMSALRSLLGQNDLLAYLAMLAGALWEPAKTRLSKQGQGFSRSHPRCASSSGVDQVDGVDTVDEVDESGCESIFGASKGRNAAHDVGRLFEPTSSR